MTIIFDDDFVEELDKIVDFIAIDSASRAAAFQVDIYTQIQAKIPFMPKKYRKNRHLKDDNVREFIYKGYVVPFRILSDDEIHILGIYKRNIWKSK